jgi:hypothetical protein
MIEQALRDPISVGMLKVDGKNDGVTGRTRATDRMDLHALLEEVLDDPTKNTQDI